MIRINLFAWPIHYLFGVGLLMLCLFEAGGCQESNRPSQANPGETQLAKILADRPNMQNIVPNEHSIRRKVIEMFNAGVMQRPIHWDKKEPESGRPAEFVHPWSNQPAVIRITAEKERSGQDKWACLVFELENLQNSATFIALQEKISNELITREAFVRTAVELELAAMQRTREFLTKHPVPGATDENSPLYKKLMTYCTDFEGFVEHIDDGKQEYDPREYFKSYYDHFKNRGW